MVEIGVMTDKGLSFCEDMFEFDNDGPHFGVLLRFVTSRFRQYAFVSAFVF